MAVDAGQRGVALDVTAFDRGLENAFGGVFDDVAIAGFRVAQRVVVCLAFGDVVDEALQRLERAVLVVNARAALEHPALHAVDTQDAVLHFETPAHCNSRMNFRAHPFAILGVGDFVVGDTIVEQQVVGAVASQPAATDADKFHGPVGVVAAAVNHAFQLVEQCTQQPFLVALEMAIRQAFRERKLLRGFVRGLIHARIAAVPVPAKKCEIRLFSGINAHFCGGLRAWHRPLHQKYALKDCLSCPVAPAIDRIPRTWRAARSRSATAPSSPRKC